MSISAFSWNQPPLLLPSCRLCCCILPNSCAYNLVEHATCSKEVCFEIRGDDPESETSPPP